MNKNVFYKGGDDMITEGLINLLERYNDMHGYSREINKIIMFLADVDQSVIDGDEKTQEQFIDKWLEIYGNT